MSQQAEASRTFLSRDVGYLRDLALFWPFVLYSIFAVASGFSPANHTLALRCAVVAIAALLLAKERLLLIFVAAGFIAIQCAIALLLHPWNWAVFVAGVCTGTLFLFAKYWRQRRLSYRLPKEFRLVDALWSVGSLVVSLMLGYVASPYN
jgi:hypothetical protein